MNVNYSTPLDAKTVKSTELDARFTELTTEINTNKVTPGQVVSQAVDYRVLQYPVKIELAREFGYPSNMTLSAAFAGYYAITQSILLHDSTHTTASDRNKTGRPVVQVQGRIWAVDVQDGDATYSAAMKRFCIGTSTDAGATWTPRLVSDFPVGESCGKIRRIYDTVPQPHYMTSVVSYFPFNFSFDRSIDPIASFGGDIEDASLAAINAFCVMVNSTSVGGVANEKPCLFGQITLNARERGF